MDTHADYRFVIIGSGFAGLFLAEKLAAPGSRVLVLEAGPLNDPLALGAGYYEIESTPDTSLLGTRLSTFGGTSNHWTGESRPFSPRIFRNRPELGIAGWPISYREFAHYLPEALRWLNLPASYDQPGPNGIETGLLAELEGLDTRRFFRSDPLPQLGLPGTRERFLDNPNIDVWADTRVIDLTVDTNEGRIASLDLVRQGGERTKLAVPTLLLCAGGIENARLMLWAGRKYPRGNPLLGGRNELTGKYFNEHPVYRPVEIFFDRRIDLSAAVSRSTPVGREHLMWALSDALLERHALLRFGVLLGDEGLAVAESGTDGEIAPTYLARAAAYKVTVPEFKFEQSADPRRAVTLTDRLDRDGVPRPRVDWTIGPADAANYRRGTLLFCSLLAQSGLIHARLQEPFRGTDWSTIPPVRASHHSSTTRMAHAASAGVVDTDCRVFGLSNMYVAGSSVFPTSDYLNPTLNLVTLAARLAEHLASRTAAQARTAYRYGAGRAENQQMRDGWSPPEERGRWSVGPKAEMAVLHRGATRFRLRGRGYHAAHIVLRVNGVTVYDGAASRLGSAQHTPEQSFDISRADEVVITFELSNLASPHELGESDDRRQLGYFIEWLELW